MKSKDCTEILRKGSVAQAIAVRIWDKCLILMYLFIKTQFGEPKINYITY